ncbi:MAG: hypothetical protein JXM70_04350 [Pirellulales bacterium]|nr:hypothetical protein [Pirellulales bacterium]
MTRRFRDSLLCRPFLKYLPAVMIATTLVFVVGCGGEGPTRYDLSGTVTFAGQPIPAGTIVFQPDTAKGNSGPQGVAAIRDGKYDTGSDGKGVIGGPHIVRITGFDRVAESENDAVTSLFDEYLIESDLPTKSGTVDFEVPADAPKAPKSTGREA